MSKIYTFNSLSDLENYINQSSPSNDIAIYAEDGVYHVKLFDKLNTNEITVPVYDENQIFNMNSIAYNLNHNLYKRINKEGKIYKEDITTAYLNNIIINRKSQDLNIKGLVDNLRDQHATNRTAFTSNTYWQW